MSVTSSIGQQIAVGDKNLADQLIDLSSQQDVLGAKYGVDPTGALDFIDPKDPFSVTGAAKRLFRQQQDQNKYGAFAGGYGLDGSASQLTANLEIAQAQKRRDITDEYTDALSGIGRQKLQASGGWAATKAGLNTDLASAFAADNTATLGAAPPAAAGVGESGYAPPPVPAAAAAPAAAARASGQTKAARGFLWRLNSDGKTWTKVRPLNAFGQ